MKRVILYIVCVACSFFSCQKLLFNDDEETREIFFSEFHAVKISGIYNIILMQDSLNKLVIKGINDINTIEAIVNNDTLNIENFKKRTVNNKKNSLELHFSNIDFLVTYSPVNISNQDTIRVERLEYEALGEIAEVSLAVDCNSILVVTSANTLGFFRLDGRANTGTFWARYGSSFFAATLKCKKIEVLNSSVGDMYINASEEIKAYIRGTGNIFYYGNPKIELAVKKGEGELIKVY